MAKPEKKQGVRIPDVADALGDRYGPEAIDVKPQPPYAKPLFCGGCGIPVYASSGNADNPESRSSHYSKKPGTEHTQMCRFDLDRRGTELVQGSQGTVVRRNGQWRLLCPDVARSASPRTPSGPSVARPGRKSGGGKRPTSRTAGPAIASARRIVQLLEDFHQDPDVLADFRAVAPGGQHSIAWEEFCHGRARAATLAQALVDGTARSIPHAVWGPAATASGVSGGKLTYVVKYVAAQPVLIQGRRVRLQVALRSANPDWIGAHMRAGQFLGYGHWQLLPQDRDSARGSLRPPAGGTRRLRESPGPQRSVHGSGCAADPLARPRAGALGGRCGTVAHHHQDRYRQRSRHHPPATPDPRTAPRPHERHLPLHAEWSAGSRRRPCRPHRRTRQPAHGPMGGGRLPDAWLPAGSPLPGTHTA
ncbi:hypothetical protein [Streptomyces sp. NPDC087300]|uniref:hypothetical protein n=1 Tax=Streptomyces sp. NPDC087300 TaxID=3365780 RepID=UPI003810A502